MFDISYVKPAELADLAAINKSTLTRLLKDEEVERVNNRCVGIPPAVCRKILRKQGVLERLFKPGIFVQANLVGGSYKSTSTLALSQANWRLASSNKEDNQNNSNKFYVIDTDKQASVSNVILGRYADNDPTLTDILDGKATIEEAAIEVKPNYYLIPSNLDNAFLSRHFDSVKDVRHKAYEFFKSIFARHPNARIFVDTSPVVDGVLQSMLIALTQFSRDNYQTVLNIPMRGDRYSYLGSKLLCKDIFECLSAFNIPHEKLGINIFQGAFDKRLKVGLEILRLSLADDLIGKYVAPRYVKSSSHASNQAFLGTSIYEGKPTTLTKDYNELLSYIGENF